MTEHTEECLSYQSKVGLAFCNCDCSDKHVHEWIPWEGEPWFFTCKDENCPRVLDVLETTERVNATERLSAEDIEYLGGLAWESSHRKEKKSQEPMLEDSEMQVRLEGAAEREKNLMKNCIAYANIREGK